MGLTRKKKDSRNNMQIEDIRKEEMRMCFWKLNKH